MTDFDRAVEAVLRIEDPKLAGVVTTDSGGVTRWGISKRAYPSTDVANLTLDQAKFLYKTDYWTEASCDDYAWPLSLFVFDAAVNQGVDAAIRMLQEVAETPVDGRVGVNTLKAIGKREPVELAAKYMARRAVRYMGDRNADQYLRGWLKRLFLISRSAYVA